MPSPTRDLFHKLPTGARLLFVRLRSMGDCLLLTSPLHALRHDFPDFRIAVLVEPRFAPCFEGNPDIDEVLPAGPTKLRAAGRLFRERFDVVVNLHGGPTSLVYSLAAGGRRYGLDDYPYGFLYSGLVPRGAGPRHTVEANLDWFRWLGVAEATPPPLYFAPNPAARTWVEERVGPGPRVTLHPGALVGTKRWPADRFRALVRELGGREWKVVITTGPGEETFALEAGRDLDPDQILTDLTIPKLAELIRGSELYIGNDSGPMHLAAAVGTPTVAIWGSSDSSRWHPWCVPHRIVQNPFDCNPCPGYECHVADTPLCIESVTLDQTVEAVWSLAAESDRGRSAMADSGNNVV